MDAELVLIRALERRQRELGLSNSAMAKKMGVSRPTWARVRHGHYPLRRSVRVLQGVAQGFPELSATLLLFLTSDNGKGNQDGN